MNGIHSKRNRDTEMYGKKYKILARERNVDNITKIPIDPVIFYRQMR